MERQRSFSLKSARVFAFIITISSAIVFLAFFSICFIKSSPLLYTRTTNIQFNDTSLHLSPLPTPVGHNLSRSTSDSSASSPQVPILISTRFNISKNTSGFARFPDFEQKAREETVVQDDVVNGNLTSAVQEVTVIELPNNVREKKEKIIEECDVTKGRWVYDVSYPLYTNASCPFIDEGFNCRSNGRLDSDYMKWRWEPQDCDIPRFNATKLLELIRGKRLVFVGDSINRNQWESMLCMLFSGIKDPKRVYETHGQRITKKKGNYSFRFAGYRCTVEYYATHFLVRESKSRIGLKRRPTLTIDAIDRSSSRWRGADILVFNTAHWWSHYKTKAGIYYYQEGNQVHPKLDVSTAFRRALQTWSSWVDKHVDPKKTRVFFRNAAPSHFRGGEWNSGGHCTEATMPFNETSKPDHSEKKNGIVEEVITQMKTPVTVLNISGLSEYRIDGHPSVYGMKPEIRRSQAVQDCSHWCLPGVPDTWNELLYFHLLHNQ
ncbi:PREDICTED: protein trichome birefringence-like 6 [Tarenaya hassleriana]|uniref:protein trichome birefringence-like 6 n=1 Tax=Tarenaya hassleriana TaxID=28532 RepID=UPI00053C4A2F|nr:PREDICTED: protein trichome birefringence-like 6 [Tarenaya hassleriana]